MPGTVRHAALLRQIGPPDFPHPHTVSCTGAMCALVWPGYHRLH